MYNFSIRLRAINLISTPDSQMKVPTRIRGPLKELKNWSINLLTALKGAEFYFA